MKKALITGIAGFAGSHLAEYLLAEDLNVYGFYHPDHSTENLENVRGKLNLVACDLQDKKKVRESVAEIHPDFVFHLAAFSSPASSFKNPQETLINNILSQLNLFESLVAQKSKAKILAIGSADEYGKISQNYLPAGENTPLSPLSPYAVSKVTQDMLGLQYFLHQKLQIVRVRPFNHIGPRQSPAFVISAFASQIAACEAAGGGKMNVGNLETYRDFTDVRDMVRAYYLALLKGKPGEVYNIGSGRATKIGDALKIMLSHSKVKIDIVSDKTRLRPQDNRIIYCDFGKFRAKTGWEPTIPIETTLSDTIEYERKKLTWHKSTH